jgi:hypothetical protein
VLRVLLFEFFRHVSEAHGEHQILIEPIYRHWNAAEPLGYAVVRAVIDDQVLPV